MAGLHECDVVFLVCLLFLLHIIALSVRPVLCRQYRSHVRSHFFTNLGVAGGLLLLQTFGAGMYSVDAILQSKKRN